MPAEDRSKNLKDLDLRRDVLSVQRSPGTYWCIESDTIGFRIDLKDKPLTRKGILSTCQLSFGAAGDENTACYNRNARNGMMSVLTAKLVMLSLFAMISANQWSLARVTEVYPSEDGFVRKVPLLVNKSGTKEVL